MRLALQSIVILLTTVFSYSPNAEQQAHVAVASNFSHTAKALVALYSQQNNQHKIILSFASSGKLYAQIVHGAPFAVFLSADQEKPQKLIDRRLAIEESLTTYAIGKLALYSNSQALSVSRHNAIDILQKAKTIALANPKTAPYGNASLATLKNLSIYDSVSNKLVWGENISQTLQFVETGNADWGFVALSQVKEKQVLWVVPQNLHPPIKQDAVLLHSGQQNSVAKAFLQFIRSSEAKEVIANFGYHTSEK